MLEVIISVVSTMLIFALFIIAFSVLLVAFFMIERSKFGVSVKAEMQSLSDIALGFSAHAGKQSLALAIHLCFFSAGIQFTLK